MENALKSLKHAEERAGEVEKHAVGKSSELVKEVEESVKTMEAEAESRAKETGERHLKFKMDKARAESANIKEKARAEGEGMEKKAKGNMSLGVDQVVDAVVKRMKSGS